MEISCEGRDLAPWFTVTTDRGVSRLPSLATPPTALRLLDLLVGWRQTQGPTPFEPLSARLQPTQMVPPTWWTRHTTMSRAKRTLQLCRGRPPRQPKPEVRSEGIWPTRTRPEPTPCSPGQTVEPATRLTAQSGRPLKNSRSNEQPGFERKDPGGLHATLCRVR